MTTAEPAQHDAYDYLGPLWEGHPALGFGLTADADDEAIEQVRASMLAHYGAPPFPPDTLGPALATWRDDLAATDQNAPSRSSTPNKNLLGPSEQSS